MSVRILRSHDEEWFRSFYHDNYRPVLAYARRRVGRTMADEVVADTFLVAWRRRDDVPDGHERPWLFGVARNTIGNAARASRRQRAVSEKLRGLAQSVTVDPASEAGNERAAVLRSALNSLSEADREILMLVAWEELSHAEIGQMLNLTPNAVAIRVHRARQRLAKRVDQLAADKERAKGPSRGGHEPDADPRRERRAL